MTLTKNGRCVTIRSMAFIPQWTLSPLRWRRSVDTGESRRRSGFTDCLTGLPPPPKNRSVLDKLLTHPKSALIRQAFGLQEADLPPEPIGADEATPLIDGWPGLGSYLGAQSIKLHLIRCDLIRKFSLGGGESELDSFIVDDTIYVTRQEVERGELELVLRELRLRLSDNQIVRILLGQLPANVQQSRQAVRDCNTDEERLLEAVGESELLRRLPQGLIAILEDSHNVPLSGIQIAQAAISTFSHRRAS